MSIILTLSTFLSGLGFVAFLQRDGDDDGDDYGDDDGDRNGKVKKFF